MEDRLKELWDRQVKFDSTAFKNAGVTRQETTLARKVALMTELGEMFNEYPDFKYWKHSKSVKCTDELKEEFADVMHFVLSLAVDIFEDEEDMLNWYRFKNDKNFERQNSGY